MPARKSKAKAVSTSSDHSYCVKCKAFTGTTNPVQTTTSNGRPCIKGTCDKCSSKKCQFVKKA